MCGGGYIRRSARAVRAVGPGAREKPTSLTLKTHTHTPPTWLSPPREKGGERQKPFIGEYWKVAEGRGWDIISIIFSKIKSQKESQNGSNQGFSYYFCMMTEGSGSGSTAGSGSIPMTSGSGSGRPQKMWIRWIRIRNTDMQ